MHRHWTLLRTLVPRQISVIKRSISIAAMAENSAIGGCTLQDLPKSHKFTSILPPDPEVPTPEASAKAAIEEPKLLLPKTVRGGLYTYVKPSTHDMDNSEVLCVSPAAMYDLGLQSTERDTTMFKEVVIGNHTFENEGIYPWATLYGGWQFGQWAGQLGDGRAISIFEGTNPVTNVRYEVQLKGAGKTPFSRFADGRAVLRSSIREFLVSEALNALSIPTTRALALSYFTNEKVLRERIEPRAVVVRMAQTWLRLGSFDIHRMRGDRKMLKVLADYCIDEVFGGLDKILQDARDGEYADEFNDLGRYRVLYREIIRRTAETTAQWQVYGFMNGVLNTDNVSIFGLSMDYGPFSFMDTYEPSFTPNHDDHSLRYCYRNTPTIMWWNLVRLGESLAEFFAIDDPKDLDTDEFLENGIPKNKFDDFVSRAETMIDQDGQFYVSTLQKAYALGFSKRLGLLTVKDNDAEEGIISSLLSVLRDYKLDFHNFFRRLSSITFFTSGDPTSEVIEKIFLTGDRGYGAPTAAKTAEAVLNWLLTEYKPRLEEENNVDDLARQRRMNKVNPRFMLRNWILDEVIKRVETKQERDVLNHVLDMALHPFNESWADEVQQPDRYADELRFLGDVPAESRGLTCSCSS
ncbi:hypothetical protein V1512DRAFT_256998 [Lipomyces arxii]|uniref:uncharacterized protein n=1 Tax=Lipomyces arxii TaxID=56418 RepID=UPI0034CFC31D